MAAKSVALASKSSVQDPLTFPAVHVLSRSVGVESADPYLVAASTIVIAAIQLEGDWPLFLFAGPGGDLQLIDFGCDGRFAVEVSSGFQVACAIPRAACGRRMVDSNEDAAKLDAITRRVAERLRSHLTGRAVAA